MKRPITALAFCVLLLTIGSVAQTQPQMTRDMTHEETVVRSAYAKLAFAIEQTVVDRLGHETTGMPVDPENAGMSPQQRIDNAQVTFTMRDFTVGPASDIVNRKATDFVTVAVDKRIQTDTGTSSYVYGPPGHSVLWFAPHAQWIPARVDPNDHLQTMTFNEFYEAIWEKERPEKLWQTYASYLVTVTFHGETRGPYKALFIFGHNEKGEEQIEPFDGVVDTRALIGAMAEHIFADPFVDGPPRGVDLIANWVKLKEISESGAECSQAQGVCCDLVKLQCGPPREDVTKRLALPPLQ